MKHLLKLQASFPERKSSFSRSDGKTLALDWLLRDGLEVAEMSKKFIRSVDLFSSQDLDCVTLLPQRNFENP